MTDRGQGRVLVVCAALALLVHAAVLAWPAVWGVGRSTSADERGREPEVDRRLPERDIELGRPDARTPSVAWISYEDYRELVAPQAPTEQPAVQQEVDPVDEAPLEPEPTPPAPTPAEAPAELVEAPDAMAREAVPPPLPELEAVGELPRPQPEADPQEATPPDTAAAAESTEAQPTAAPRSDAEADPTQIDPSELAYRTGGVIVGPGIEIHTVKPKTRPSMWTAFPRNPTVRVYFNAEGKVDRAVMVQSTGFSDWDGMILASLYRWRAEGERIDAADPHVMIQIQYLLHDHPN